MTRFRTIVVLIIAAAAVIATLATVCKPQADEDEEKPVSSTAAQVSRGAAGHVFIALQPAARKAIGLTTETLKPVAEPVEVQGYGLVLDPAPLSSLNSDLIAAQAALDASTAEYQRSRQLYAERKNVSLRDLQTAQAAYLTGKAHRDALEQQLRDAWGSDIARMDSPARSELVGALVDRREAIVRVTVPAGTALDGLPRSARIVAIGHERNPLTARAVYYAPTVDPRMQGQTLLLLANTDEFPLRPGMAASAHLAAAATAEQGVMVPRSAVVRYAGKQWVYEELETGRFTRREIVPAQSISQGYFVTQNFKPGMRIVVTGAQTLLSEELKAQIRPAD